MFLTLIPFDTIGETSELFVPTIRLLNLVLFFSLMFQAVLLTICLVFIGGVLCLILEHRLNEFHSKCKDIEKSGQFQIFRHLFFIKYHNGTEKIREKQKNFFNSLFFSKKNYIFALQEKKLLKNNHFFSLHNIYI